MYNIEKKEGFPRFSQGYPLYLWISSRKKIKRGGHCMELEQIWEEALKMIEEETCQLRNLDSADCPLWHYRK